MSRYTRENALQDLWETDLDQRGKEVLGRYDAALPKPSIDSALGAVWGFFGTGILLTILGASTDTGFVSWRSAIIMAAAATAGYLVGRSAQRREIAHRQALIAALHRAA